MKKKGLLGLAMCAMLAFSVAGCNKDKVEGIYEFDSIAVTSDGETKYYSCSGSEGSGSAFVSQACESVKAGAPRWELDDGKAHYYAVDKNGNTVDGDFDSATVDYKIEDGVFKVREDADGDFVTFGTYEDGKILVNIGYPDGISIVFKKN